MRRHADHAVITNIVTSVHGRLSWKLAISFEQARSLVLKHSSAFALPAIERVPLLEAPGRVLAEPVHADRDYPPVTRSVRDGFAVRAADLPGILTVAGEVRAGEQWTGLALEGGQAIEIMTGAPMPDGADAVVMVEHVERRDASVITDRTLRSGENVNHQGKESPAGAALAMPGRVLRYADVAMLATVGRASVAVYKKPSVAILATGDEVVPVETQTPEIYQVRNSNSYSLAAQVARAGGDPTILPVARDVYEATRQLVEQGLQHDLLLLSGGVSAGKYDIVEKVLADVGAEFYFDRVKIQPGQPVVFGKAQGKLFFGLPGNPASTMVTFEVLARAALERLTGIAEPTLTLAWAKLARPFRHKPGLTRFLPANLNAGVLTPVAWAGSSDVPALARANAYLVAGPEKPEYAEGDWIQVLMQ